MRSIGIWPTTWMIRNASGCRGAITRVELRAGARSGSDVEQARRLLGGMTEYPVDRQVAEEAGRTRHEAGILLQDALIAATALVHGLTVHTRNVRDFKRVPGLRIRSPR
jgi:toxin FitB